MSQNRVLFVTGVAILIALVLGGGYQAEGTAQVQSSDGVSVPQSMSLPYTANLTDRSGNQVDDGLYDFTFTLYAAETTTEPFWSEVQKSIEVLGGEFSTSLGRFNPISSSLLEGTNPLWLEVGVRGPDEREFTMLEPRQQLNASSQTAQASSTAGDACAHDHFGEMWHGAEDIGLHVITDIYTGVIGRSENHIGVAGISTTDYVNFPPDPQYGVFGISTNDHGIYGVTDAEWSWISGVYGEAYKTNNIGVTGWNHSDGVGVYGYSENGTAGYFNGPVEVVGYLTKSGGGFKIDHPLDPANKFLNHSFVESPDMKNFYDGMVNLDADGAAWVELPAWFEALNKDFRYQLTPIGAPASNLYIAQEIENNRFRIAGGEPALKVSWQVTGSRHDPYAEAHPIPVEEVKPAKDQDTYLHPEEYGMPETEGISYQRFQSPEQIETGGE
jgi:hypothetical protein